MDGITNSIDITSGKLRDIVKYRKAWCATVLGLQRFRHKLATEKQQHYDQCEVIPHCDFDFPFSSNECSMHLTESEVNKKRWEEYTEEKYKKDFNDPDNHDSVITHLEPDKLECEVKWTL